MKNAKKKQAKNQHFRSFIVFLSTISRLLHKILFFHFIAFYSGYFIFEMTQCIGPHLYFNFGFSMYIFISFRELCNISLYLFVSVYVCVCIWTFINRVSFERISFRKWFLVYSSAMDRYTHGTHCTGLFWSFVFMVSLICVLLHDVFRQIDSISFLVSMFLDCSVGFFFFSLPNVYYNVTSCSIGRIISSFFYLFVI